MWAVPCAVQCTVCRGERADGAAAQLGQLARSGAAGDSRAWPGRLPPIRQAACLSAGAWPNSRLLSSPPPLLLQTAEDGRQHVQVGAAGVAAAGGCSGRARGRDWTAVQLASSKWEVGRPGTEQHTCDGALALLFAPAPQVWILQPYCDQGTLNDAIDRGWLRAAPDAPPDPRAVLLTAQARRPRVLLDWLPAAAGSLPPGAGQACSAGGAAQGHANACLHPSTAASPPCPASPTPYAPMHTGRGPRHGLPARPLHPARRPDGGQHPAGLPALRPRRRRRRRPR